MATVTLQEAGPLLKRLVQAEKFEQEVVGHEQIEAIADALAQTAAELRDCLVWPVGPAAERVAGVLTARTRGAVLVGGWNTCVEGRRVLLFAVAALTPLPLETAARQLRSRGAAEVHACAIHLDGAIASDVLDSCLELFQHRGSRSLTLAGAA
jgi:hypothetical protein